MNNNRKHNKNQVVKLKNTTKKIDYEKNDFINELLLLEATGTNEDHSPKTLNKTFYKSNDEIKSKTNANVFYFRKAKILNTYNDLSSLLTIFKNIQLENNIAFIRG